jgi:hypothetical protein
MSTERTEAIVRVLISKGQYKRTPEPLHVADVDFDFDAVLTGPTDETRLVVVIDTDSVSLAVLRTRVEALAAVLEGTGSRRPLTTVIIGDRVADEARGMLEDLCRVIIVPEWEDAEECLGQLLPLELPRPYESRVSAEQSLRSELGSLGHDAMVKRLLATGSKGAHDVELYMRSVIEKASADPGDEEAQDD